MLAEVAALGVPVDGAVLPTAAGSADGVAARRRRRSPGCSRAAASPDHPELRPLLTGLPVAGLTGTLVDRFDSSRGRRGARASSGPRPARSAGCSSLAGTVVDADGRLLAFAVLADAVPATRAGPARPLDRVVTALAGCGCR